MHIWLKLQSYKIGHTVAGSCRSGGVFYLIEEMSYRMLFWLVSFYLCMWMFWGILWRDAILGGGEGWLGECLSPKGLDMNPKNILNCKQPNNFQFVKSFKAQI